jgi:hypothetical protein
MTKNYGYTYIYALDFGTKRCSVSLMLRSHYPRRKSRAYILNWRLGGSEGLS